MPKKRRHGTPRTLPVRLASRADGLLALEVGGVTQSVSLPPERAASEDPLGYWELMLPPERPRDALLLGLGGATVAALLARRWPGVRMLGIAPGGCASVNLMLTGRTPEQLHRLRRVFSVTRE